MVKYGSSSEVSNGTKIFWCVARMSSPPERIPEASKSHLLILLAMTTYYAFRILDKQKTSLCLSTRGGEKNETIILDGIFRQKIDVNVKLMLEFIFKHMYGVTYAMYRLKILILLTHTVYKVFKKSGNAKTSQKQSILGKTM